jgi:hypothetical protein
MSVGDVVSLLGQGISGVVAIAMLALFITGQIVPKSRVDEIKEDRDDYRRALEAERQISNMHLQTSLVVKDVMQSLRKELEP